MININENAPVKAQDQIEIQADLESVWKIMADINRWSEWNKEIESASISGDLEVGKKFQWKAGPGTIKSELLEVEPPRRIAWKGNTMGIKAVHVWYLDFKDNKTIVTTEESWDGLIVRIFKGSMQKTLQSSISSGLNYLKKKSEENTP